MSAAHARLLDAQILEEDGPHELWFDPDDFSAPGQLAAAAATDPEERIGSYAAVLGTARRAIVGVFTATEVTQDAAMLVALARGLARFGKGERVEVLLQQAQLRQRLRDPLFVRKADPGCGFGGVLVYRRETSLVQRYLRSLHATFPEVPARPGNKRGVPPHPLLASAYRLSWIAYQRAMECAPLDDEALLAWMPGAALQGGMDKLRNRYRRWASALDDQPVS